MAYEVLIWSDKVSNARTGIRAVTFLVRQNTNVKAAEVTLPAGADAAEFGAANAAALYSGGVSPSADVSPLALFYAAQARLAEPYFLGVIFAAFHQLKIGGDLAEMIVAGRTALAADDAMFAQWQAFEAAYNAGTGGQQATINAMAVWVVLNIIAAK